MQIKVVGIDCSTTSKNVGLVLSRWDGQRLVIEDARCPKDDAAEEVSKWISLSPETTFLLALDAPLGWPAEMSQVLPGHMAGMPLSPKAEMLFTRATDRFVRQQLRKRALEVGANLIARTAYWALGFLNELGRKVGEPISLAWAPSPLPRVAAIEVYPAATYLAHGITTKRYSRPKDSAARHEIGQRLREEIMAFDGFAEKITTSPHLLDAAACALGGADFLSGNAWGPEDKEKELALKEGWIWFRKA